MMDRDPQELARSMALEALRQGKTVRLGFLGGSMSPLLRPGDGIRVGPLPRRVRPGDIVLYMSGDVLVAHRVLRGSSGGPGSVIRVKGDFTPAGGESLALSRCLGLVLSRERDGSTLDLRTPRQLLLGRVMSFTSPWAVALGFLFPRPLRRALRRVLFFVFRAPPEPEAPLGDNP